MNPSQSNPHMPPKKIQVDTPFSTENNILSPSLSGLSTLLQNSGFNQLQAEKYTNLSQVTDSKTGVTAAGTSSKSIPLQAVAIRHPNCPVDSDNSKKVTNAAFPTSTPPPTATQPNSQDNNLASSFRKDNGKRLQTRAPLVDEYGVPLRDYPHLEADQAATVTTAYAPIPPPTNQPLSNELSFEATITAPAPASIVDMDLDSPVAAQSSNFVISTSSVSGPSNVFSMPMAYSPDRRTSGGLFGNHLNVLNGNNLFSSDRTPDGSPARQALQFHSGEKPSSASDSSSKSRITPLSPLNMESPVIKRNTASNSRRSNAFSRMQDTPLQFNSASSSSSSSDRGSSSKKVPSHLEASPTPAMAIVREQARARFQITHLDGWAPPPPNEIEGGGLNCSFDGTEHSDEATAVNCGDHKPAVNHADAAIASSSGAAATAAAIPVPSAHLPPIQSTAFCAAENERHKPKRARCIAASLSTCVNNIPTAAGDVSPSTANAFQLSASPDTPLFAPFLQSSASFSHPPNMSLLAAASNNQAHPVGSRMIQRTMSNVEERDPISSMLRFGLPHIYACDSNSDAALPLSAPCTTTAASAAESLLSSALAADESLCRTFREVASQQRAQSVIPQMINTFSSSCSASPRLHGASPSPEAMTYEAFPSPVLVGSTLASSPHSAMDWSVAQDGQIHVSMEAMSAPASAVGEANYSFPAIPNPFVMPPNANQALVHSNSANNISDANSSAAAAASSSFAAAAASSSSSATLAALHRRGSCSMLDDDFSSMHPIRGGSMRPLENPSFVSNVAAAAAAAAAFEAKDEADEDFTADYCSSTSAYEQEGDSSCSSSGHTHGGILPSINGVGDVKRISGATMSRLLSGEFQGSDTNQLDNFIVIDCRYDYEYAGGHIEGAINVNDRALLSKFFRANSELGSRLAIIFHCEFSQNRAPKSYKFFRSLDRLRNAQNYPYLSYPEIAVLEGGYKAFHAGYPGHCALSNRPAGSGAYVSMWDEKFSDQCRARTAEHRRSWGTCKQFNNSRGGGGRSSREKRATMGGGVAFSPAVDAQGRCVSSSNGLFARGGLGGTSLFSPSPAPAASNVSTATKALAGPIAALAFTNSPSDGSAAASSSSSSSSSAASSASRPRASTISGMPFSPLPALSLSSAGPTPVHHSSHAKTNDISPPPFRMSISSPEKEEQEEGKEEHKKQ